MFRLYYLSYFTAELRVACLSHDRWLNQVMMHFLNDVAYDAEPTQKSKITL